MKSQISFSKSEWEIKGCGKQEKKNSRNLHREWCFILVLNAIFVLVLDWAGMNYDKDKMMSLCSCKVSSHFLKRKRKLRTKGRKKKSSHVTKLILESFSITPKSNCIYQTNMDINILQSRQKNFHKIISPNIINHCFNFLSVVH